jgi:MraZ protein
VNRGGLEEVAQKPTGYSGQGFSLRGGGDRFVLPPDMRNPISEASGERVLCVAKHESWPCLIGFGTDRVSRFEEILDDLEDKAIRAGKDFDRAMRSAKMWSFKRLNFDASGRFIFTSTLTELGRIKDELYFHGVGQVITIWNPDVLLGLGEEFEIFQVYCRQEMAEARAKGKGK